MSLALRVVLGHVADERARQHEKWGEQNHPDGTGAFKPEADRFRALTERMASIGQLCWWHILLEEVYEALAEEDPLLLREELIQSAAVIAAWVEAIDRRTSIKEEVSQ